MRPIVHWLQWQQQISGMYSYTYALHKACLELGHESHVCYTNPDLKTGGTIRMPNPAIGVVEFSPWEVSEGAINVTHDLLPHQKLDNWVYELHGTPLYTMNDMETLTVTAYKLSRAKMAFTRFKSHIPYWNELASIPIHYIPPGVDLNYWKPDGPVSLEFQRPIVLWADTARIGVKDPKPLLYAMKIVNREMPTVGLKLVALPPDEISGYAYLCGRLGLDSIIEWPLQPMHVGMDRVYRAVARSGGVLYSDTDEEGSNVSWEAEATGLRVIHHKDTPDQIAEAIISELKNPQIKPVRRDIRKTADAFVAHLEMGL